MLKKKNKSPGQIYINTAQALILIEEEMGWSVTLPTLIAWLSKNKLGRKIGGRWQVDRNALTEYMRKGISK